MEIVREHTPLISVIMPVFNGEKHIAEAIQSILDQTLSDFEFLIINDGSTDRTSRIINGFKDKRIILEHNSVNKGNYRCRNLGIEFAKGKYICVMDSDDISYPERFEKQVSFMENSTDTGICGCHVRNIPINTITRYITDYETLKVCFLSNNHCSHPSLIMRKAFLDKYNLRYNERYYYSSDFDLCARACQCFKVQNIPDVLLKYRKHPGQISSQKFFEQKRYADLIRINQLCEFLGFEIEEIPVLLHLKLMAREPLNLRYKPGTEKWIERILEKNVKSRYYDQTKLMLFLQSFTVLS